MPPSKRKHLDGNVEHIASTATPPSKRRQTENSAQPRWQDIFLNYPIFDNVCTHLDPQSLLAFQGCTKLLSSSFESVFKTQWNIDRLLSRFVYKPKELRSQMAKCGALISGGVALQFFNRTVWKESDLDLYVHGDANSKLAGALGEHILRVERYRRKKEIPNRNPYEDGISGISEVQTFTRPRRGEKPSQIQIIFTREAAIQTILQGYYTTAIMNVISWNTAYCLFPDLTFIRRTTYPLKHINDTYRPLIEKYSGRGFNGTLVLLEVDSRWTKSLDTEGIRRIGDPMSWKINLDTAGITAGPPSTSLEHCFFGTYQVLQLPQPGRTQTYQLFRVTADCVESPALRYKYTASDVSQAFWEYMYPILENITEAEVFRLGKDETSSWTAIPAGRRWEDSADEPDLSVDRIPPVGWAFYDDQIPQWFVEFEEKRMKQLTRRQSPDV